MKRDTYNDFDRQIYITLTNKCNWSCEYCDFPSKTDAMFDVDNSIDILKIIPDNTEVILEGGEIGLLSEEFLDRFFYSGISKTYAVTTNGEFLNRSYHTKYMDKLHYILYHIAPELTHTTEVMEYDVGDARMDYTFVLHQNNIEESMSVLERHPHLNFLIHMLQPRVEGLDIDASPVFYKQVLENVKHRANIGEYFKKRLVRIAGDISDTALMSVRRKLCSTIYNQISINLPDNRIHRCCVSMRSDWVDFSKSNLIDVLRNSSIYPVRDGVCERCIANFIWDSNKIKKYNKNRKTKCR